MSSAMWAAIDGLRLDTAQRHFDRAATLAAMSGDSSIQFRVWSHAGMLYRRLGRHTDALAANDVARGLPVARRDPLFASLGLARQAVISGETGDRRGAQQSIGNAEEALGRAAADVQRPMWLTAFYDRAELENLALCASFNAGDFRGAEAHAHRSLALLRPDMHRNRAVISADLAYAQLRQADLEPAVATAMSIPAEFTHHPRVTEVLGDFARTLQAIAPSSPFARNWNQHVHDSRRAPSE
ncbi:hypothetical protein GCM10018793_44780 [Streptomyces sulfonofaciens]|uniref:Tetratricopeptide repeat protein n=2 Tax=Streptomyces sulfonofaciens TaxID=68272 RepID=A0A919GE79_9ACTN|nr:hypothetical protein GCM10018793_44780 [Streptomyces sulfonofaciens]